MAEKANYVTCPQGHKVFLIWSDQYQRFGFTCDECGKDMMEIEIAKKA